MGNNMRNGLGKSYYKNNNIKYKPIHDLRCKILNSWIEVGNTNSNERLFGSWDYNNIKYEFRYSNCWDVYVDPFKQKTKVFYKDNKGRIYIWEFEKCLMEINSEWSVISTIYYHNS